jgi:hypothetical protein
MGSNVFNGAQLGNQRYGGNDMIDQDMDDLTPPMFGQNYQPGYQQGHMLQSPQMAYGMPYQDQDLDQDQDQQYYQQMNQGMQMPNMQMPGGQYSTSTNTRISGRDFFGSNLFGSGGK